MHLQMVVGRRGGSIPSEARRCIYTPGMLQCLHLQPQRTWCNAHPHILSWMGCYTAPRLAVMICTVSLAFPLLLSTLMVSPHTITISGVRHKKNTHFQQRYIEGHDKYQIMFCWYATRSAVLIGGWKTIACFGQKPALFWQVMPPRTQPCVTTEALSIAVLCGLQARTNTLGCPWHWLTWKGSSWVYHGDKKKSLLFYAIYLIFFIKIKPNVKLWSLAALRPSAVGMPPYLWHPPSPLLLERTDPSPWDRLSPGDAVWWPD